MKKLFLLGAAVCALWSCTESVDGYRVKVKVEGDLAQLKSDTLVLTNGAKGEDLITSTAVLSNGVAVFEGAAITTPQRYSITVNGDRIAALFLENGISEVKVVLAEGVDPDFTVKGGRWQTVSDSLHGIQATLFEQNNMEALMNAYDTVSKEEQAKIEALYDSLNTIVAKAGNDYVANNPTSLFSLSRFSRNIEKMPFAEADAKLAAFKAVPEYALNKTLADAEKLVEKLRALQPGMVAPDFVQNDVDGKPVKFSEFYKKNKVTMVDFWASWCTPCRRFNPTLVQIYKEFKGKGFGIIGVSLDRDKDSWVKAIKDDKLKWEHVSDLGYWDNEVARMYHVRYIPQSILVDQDGKIIKRQPTEEELVEVLKEYLNKK